ncbi:MAG TPA: hypothetical protein VFT50_09365 [Baekduia sp.]|nr:hypothetical protein [Baekduia sp.]
MEIRPVSIDQIALGEDGRCYEVTGEAGRIAQDLQAIDPTLVVHFKERGDYFVVAQRLADPRDPLQTRDYPVMRVAADDWNERIVREFEMRNHELRHGQSAADRLDAEDERRKRAADQRFEEAVGEACVDLFRAFQRGLGTKPRIFVPSRDAVPQAA